MLDKITIRLFYIAFVSGALASYIWGYQPIGVLVFSIPALIGAVTHVMYWNSLIDADKELQETRVLDPK